MWDVEIQPRSRPSGPCCVDNVHVTPMLEVLVYRREPPAKHQTRPLTIIHIGSPYGFNKKQWSVWPCFCFSWFTTHEDTQIDEPVKVALKPKWSIRQRSCEVTSKSWHQWRRFKQNNYWDQINKQLWLVPSNLNLLECYKSRQGSVLNARQNEHPFLQFLIAVTCTIRLASVKFTLHARGP